MAPFVTTISVSASTARPVECTSSPAYASRSAVRPRGGGGVSGRPSTVATASTTCVGSAGEGVPARGTGSTPTARAASSCRSASKVGKPPAPFTRDDRQHDVRGIPVRVQHGLPGDLHPRAGADVLAGVEVPREARKARARDVHAHAMSAAKDVRSRIAADPILGHLAGLEQLDRLSLDARPVARADDALGEEDRTAVRVDVAEPHEEVGVAGRRRGVEDHLDRADDLQFVLEGVARVDEHVVALLQGALVERTRPDRRLRALRHREHGIDAADRRDRFGRVVVVAVARLAGGRLVTRGRPPRAGRTASPPRARAATPAHPSRHRRRARRAPPPAARPSRCRRP